MPLEMTGGSGGEVDRIEPGCRDFADKNEISAGKYLSEMSQY